MDKEWRKFEELVARIEKLLAPSGAIVKSPDIINEIVTAAPREIDATIKFKVGTVPILITIECRKRDNVQDVRWIEELVTKKKNIGASETIAVSSVGFSENAIANAKNHGIKIRTINEISDKEILDWPNILKFKALQISVKSGPLMVVMYSDKKLESVALTPEVDDLYKKFSLNADVLTRTSDGSKWSISKIYGDLLKGGNKVQELRLGQENQFHVPPNSTAIFFSDPIAHYLLEDVPMNGNDTTKKLVLRFSKGQFLIETNQGNLEVSELAVDVTVACKPTSVLDTKIVQYSSDKKTLIQLAETELLLDETKNLKVTITQNRLLE